ncbi:MULTISPECIES: UDP-N-acetylmuramoyl-L-alanine--D-glutamate ligase [unclassified Novosphingobium]|uniref:UDP-N-acetylmuramoyl-L-alanine--D-glutamate ligase n=1 Tax=unclassified Novosphingobium TaxID=2644732 RepID=UPI00146ED15B|nr:MULTISPECIES: UDP-N-acetylmuramoyl-L-alanine--D-glutamate ligase [unclassified Novosphingobium]NMN06251.1 UDP-N-acetylmuramoylalanine--D-glutamate ligase [Novosphingobium sp. SG919]NMN88548.1 UDP-N-acetylmuramoylalanine--D-glutamate ligase [Novosphingobium sp. SG916]
MIVSSAFAGKKYAVLGLARSGMATVECLLASGAHVTAWDAREEPRAALEGRATLADPLAIDLAGFAGVVVSPGVPLNRHPIAAHARGAGVPVIGDIELFAQARADLPAHRVVAITGTNGKSTTTALTHHLLQAAGVPSLMGGNIGKPILEQQPLPAGGVYVLELSSYQIDLTQRLDADVAVLLNVSPDHLDRYDGYDAYVASKARLFGMQAHGHLALVDMRAELEDDVLRFAPEGTNFQFINGIDLPGDPAQWPSLQGPHNRANAAAAVGAARYLGLDEATIAAGLKSFVGLPHRMERVAEKNGVLFVNDSKATNPASTAPALAAFPRIHWIVGGLPKGDDLDECAPHFGHVVRAYTIGEAGPRFAEILEPVMPVTRAEMLGDAVRAAMEQAVPGDVIMLSPACASFDQFRDFEARGECFRQIVAALTAGS